MEWKKIIKGNFFEDDRKNVVFKKAIVGTTIVLLPITTGILLMVGWLGICKIIGLYLITLAIIVGGAFFTAA